MPDGQRRRLVIDANILIRAVLGRRGKETITSHTEDVDFFAPEDAYLDIKDQALARIQRDPGDWPVLAVAMLLDCPIWTEDNDFFGTGVPTWTTDRVDIYLAPPT